MPQFSPRRRRVTLSTRMIFRGRPGLPLPPRGGWGASKFYFFVFIYLISSSFTFGAVPRFFESNRMAALYLPTDTEVDSIIYRLRAEDTDRDYPLLFRIKESIGQNLIYLEAHECTPSTDIFCEADVYLRMSVEAGRLYAFNLTVSDGRGFQTEVPARVYATEGRATPISDIFIKYSPTITIKEDIPPKAVISTMTVRKRQFSTFGEFEVLGPARKTFRMTPANLVSRESINGTLVLEQKVDYEQANLHTFKVCLLQPYTIDESVDTRNIACVLMSVVIEDVQDEPPVFTNAPPVSRVPATAVQGDNVVQIEAKDGDRGIPRQIRYSILPASSLYTQYFKMNPMTGIISMNETALKLREKMLSLDPILMTVTAEEVSISPEYRALSSSVEIAFVVLDAEFLVPKFVHESYVGEVYEDSLPDTEVTFNSPFLTQGVKGLFAMELDGDKGAFSVQPGVVTDAGEMKIKVKNSFLVDYEKSPQISFKLVARQMTSSRQTTGTADITVKIIDTNDNAPQFSQPQYEVSIFENITRGTSILRVYATDEDSGQFGLVRYTNLYGDMSEKLYLEPTTGLITCATDNHGFDREKAAELILTVEAKDNNGQGATANTATAKIIIRLKDINDSPPRFVDSIYKGVMAPDRQRLKDPIIFRAVDEDAERPNNEVVYEIMRSSYSDYFYIDRTSGRFDVNPNFFPRTRPLSSETQSRERRQLADNDTVISLTVRATDLGNPPLSDFVDVKIFRQEYGERVIRFIYPKDDLYIKRNQRELESTLNILTGGSTEILDSKPLRASGFAGDVDLGKSEVVALVRFDMNTIIDVESLLLRLNSSEVEKLKVERQQKEIAITEMRDTHQSYVIGVIFLCIFLAILILVFLLCFCVEGCPLYRSSKGAVSDDGSEGVSYIRVEDTAKYRGANNEDLSGTPGWWQMLPLCMKDILLFFGYIPPGKKSSRLAWSGDERQRFGRITQPPEAAGLENRGGMVQAVHRQQQQQQQHSLLLEDIDGGRGTMGGQMIRQQGMMDPNIQSNEPRRVFVLKDTMGIPRAGDSLREGTTYLLEDVEDQPRNVNYPNDMMYNQGNAEFLRQHVSPHDAAFYSEDQRRVRRADMGPEGAVLLHDDPEGGQRFINGQMVSQNAGYKDGYGYQQGYGPSSYPQNEVYPRGEVVRVHNQQKPRGRGPREDDIRYNGGDTDRSYRERVRSKRNPPTEAHQVDRSTDPLDRNTKSARSSNIPGTYGYQHTKTSILRYETNKSKIEEEREEMLRQGKNPDDYCISHQGGAYILAADSRKGSMKDKEGRSISRRSQNQFSIPGERPIGLERRGSLTDIETNLEKEAARRIQIRRNSAGMQEQANIANTNSEVDYDAENERTEEIERRIQQRRSEASEALSEELYSQNRDNQNNNLQTQKLHQSQQIQQLQQPQQPQNQQIHQYQQPQQNQQFQQSQQPQEFQQTQQPVHAQQLQLQNSQFQQSQDTRVVDLPQAHLQGQQPFSINVTPINPETQANALSGQIPNSEANVYTSNLTSQANNGPQFTVSNNGVNISKESIEKAIASALVDMAVNNYGKESSPQQSNNLNISNPNANYSNQGPSGDGTTAGFDNVNISNQGANNVPSQEHNINLSSINIKNLAEKSIASNANIDNETSTSLNIDSKDDALKIMEGEINLGMARSATIFEKNLKNDSSILNIPKDKRKRNKMLEKKSIFTIAYDGMKTDQLRPDSAKSNT